MSNSITMLGRNFKHTVRNPVAVFNAVLFPIVLMLMFVYVIGAGADGPSKIGMASDVGRRARNLQTANPMDLRVDHCEEMGAAAELPTG